MKLDATKLQIEMARKCMNQKSLAEKTGCTSALISDYLKKSSGSPKRIGLIAEALGVDVTSILPDERVGGVTHE